MKLYVLEPYPVGRHMGASHTKIARPRGNSKELLRPTKLQFMVKNEWWTYPDIPFPIFIYLFIFLSFGFSFRSIDVLDCIESRRNIFGFWILLIIPVPLNPSLVLAVELRSKTRGMGKWPNYTRFHTKTGQKPYPVRPIKGCTSRNPDPLGGPPLGPTPQVLSVSSC